MMNRLAWWLAGVLSVVMLGGTAVLRDYGTRISHIYISYMPVGY